jgi:hypothetical protein
MLVILRFSDFIYLLHPLTTLLFIYSWLSRGVLSSEQKVFCDMLQEPCFSL